MEDNIFEDNRGQLIISYGAAGCVIGYNYFVNAHHETANIQATDISIHSSYPLMNLFEGNVTTQGSFAADNFHGNGGYMTIFRNWLKGKQAGKTSGLSSIELNVYHRYYTAVGNVLGYDGIVADVLALHNPTGTVSYSDEAPSDSAYNNHYKAFMLGYLACGGNHARYDTEVANTLLRHGNYS